MLFAEALEQLKAGEKLYRKGWQILDGYVAFMAGMTHAWKIVLQPQPNAGNYMWSMEDFSASDWEKFVLEAPKADIEAPTE